MKRSIFRFGLAVACVLAGLVGCAEMKQLDDWAMAKAKENKAAAAQSGSATAVAGTPSKAQCQYNPGYALESNCCIVPPYISSLDVDTAGARALREFNWPTKVNGRGKDPQPTRLYRYQAYPGSKYMAAHEVLPRSDPSLSQGFYLVTEIEKSGTANSYVEAAYCETPGLRAADQAAWHRSIQTLIYATLPPKK
jgi:hypothetical protein